jgi:hypothetical protein
MMTHSVELINWSSLKKQFGQGCLSELKNIRYAVYRVIVRVYFFDLEDRFWRRDDMSECRCKYHSFREVYL